MSRLTARQQVLSNERRCLILKSLNDGMTQTQVAVLLGITQGRVSQILHDELRRVATESVESYRAAHEHALQEAALEMLNVLRTEHVKVDHGIVVTDSAGKPLLDPEPKTQAAAALTEILRRHAILMNLDMTPVVHVGVWSAGLRWPATQHVRPASTHRPAPSDKTVLRTNSGLRAPLDEDAR